MIRYEDLYINSLGNCLICNNKLSKILETYNKCNNCNYIACHNRFEFSYLTNDSVSLIYWWCPLILELRDSNYSKIIKTYDKQIKIDQINYQKYLRQYYLTKIL